MQSRSKISYLLFSLALAKLLFLIIFAGNYGLFRDEYYYLECSKHLDWGFVDHPPLSMAILAVSRNLFGESLIAIRVFAYLAGAAIVFLAGLIAKEAGGKSFAQVFAAFVVFFAGTTLGASSYYSMNVFDILIISSFFYILLKYLNTGNRKLLLWIGVIIGLAIQNKLTILFVLAGLAPAVLISRERKLFVNREIVFAAVIAFVIALPFILWQVYNGLPTLEFMRNASQLKNISYGLFEFLLNVLLEFNPVNVIFILPALYFGLIDKEGKKYLIPVLTFVFVFLIFAFAGGKPYYLGVFQPVILAIGVVAIEKYSSADRLKWIRYISVVLAFISILIITPFAVPVLSVNNMIRFMDFIGIKPSVGERVEIGLLPQFYADRFGWEEMAQKTAEAVGQLEDKEKDDYIIFAQNYGEAGAINYYREKYNLKEAYTYHNSYWYWGLPERIPDVFVVVGGDLEGNQEFFEEVTVAARHRNKYAMGYENVDIYICRKPKVDVREAWLQLKRFI